MGVVGRLAPGTQWWEGPARVPYSLLGSWTGGAVLRSFVRSTSSLVQQASQAAALMEH